MDEKRGAPGSYDFLWLSLALLPLLFISLLLPLTPHDYWWYLRLGQDILRAGYVPSIETYSFTYAGTPVIYQPWLSAVIFRLAYSGGGMDFTFLLRALFIGAAYGLLWLWMRQLGAGPRLAAVLIIIAGLAGSNNWSFRPQMFAYPLFTLTLVILWNWQTGKNKTAWLLPLIALLWANIHESFLLLFLLEGAALVFGKGNRKTLTLVIVFTFLASLVTPYGMALWKSLSASFLSPLAWDVSSEWLPPANLGWQMNIFFAWVLLLPLFASLSPRRPSKLEWVWLLGLLWMSFSGLRYVIWGLIIMAAFTANLLADWDLRWLDRPARSGHPVLNYALALIFLFIPLVALPGARARLGIKSPPVISVDTPLAATAWLSQHPELPGPLWSDLTFSSYLIFALPSRPVWVDTRFALAYPAEQYQRFSQIAGASPNWQALLDRDNINLLMISPQSEPNLLQAVAISGQWCRQYRDDIAVIFSRNRSGQPCP